MKKTKIIYIGGIIIVLTIFFANGIISNMTKCNTTGGAWSFLSCNCPADHLWRDGDGCYWNVTPR